MQKILIIVLFLFFSCSNQVAYVAQLPFPKTEQSIIIVSDLHWQHSESIHRTEYLDEITNALIYEISKSPIDTLIVCGDITNNGRLSEHKDVVNFFKAIEKNGTEVFVTMGNHDFGKETTPIILQSMYEDFGYSDAISYDTDSMSYLSDLNGELWLLSLDLNVYGNKKSDMAATISDTTLLWIENCLEMAQKEGVMVLPFSHHNLIEHTLSGYEKHYNIDRGDDLRSLLLKYNVPAYFSGHRHRSFIADGSSKERKLVEFVLGTTISYPHSYGVVTYNPDRTIDYSDMQIDVDTWALENGIENKELLTFSDYSKTRSENAMRETIYTVLKNVTDDEEEQKKLAEYYFELSSHSREKTLHTVHNSLKEREEYEMWKKYKNEIVFAKWIPWTLEKHVNDRKEHTIAF